MTPICGEGPGWGSGTSTFCYRLSHSPQMLAGEMEGEMPTLCPAQQAFVKPSGRLTGPGLFPHPSSSQSIQTNSKEVEGSCYASSHPSRAHVPLDPGRWTRQGGKDHESGKAPEGELKGGSLGSGLGQALLPFHFLRSAQSVLVWLLSCQHHLTLSSVSFLEETAHELHCSCSTMLWGWVLLGSERRTVSSWSFLEERPRAITGTRQHHCPSDTGLSSRKGQWRQIPQGPWNPYGRRWRGFKGAYKKADRQKLSVFQSQKELTHSATPALEELTDTRPSLLRLSENTAALQGSLENVQALSGVDVVLLSLSTEDSGTPLQSCSIERECRSG